MTAPVVVVTGASSGTGAAAARALHRLGARVVVVGRDPDRTRAVADAVGSPALTADLAVLDEVRALADRLLEHAPRIDVLADNAGAAVPTTTPTVDGHEPNYQVNALAPFLLTLLLAPALARGRGRVVATSSRSHRGATLRTEGLAAQLDSPGGRAHDRYARAKLAAALLHRELGRRDPALEIADFHPGIVATDFGRYLGRRGEVLRRVAAPLLRTPEQAARDLVRLVTTPDPIGGVYVVRDRPAAPSPLLDDAALAAAVWDDARRRLGALRPTGR